MVFDVVGRLVGIFLTRYSEDTSPYKEEGELGLVKSLQSKCTSVIEILTDS